MNIINIHTNLQISSENQISSIEFNSQNTFLDADMIFWNLEHTHSKFREYAVNPKIESIFNNYEELFITRKRELKEFFNKGRCLVIFSPNFDPIEFKVTNKSKVTSTKSLNFAELLSSQSLLKLKAKTSIGQKVSCIDNEQINGFFSKYCNNFSYNKQIIGEIENPIMFINGTKHVVGAYFRVEGGKIFFLPNFNSNLKPPFEDFLRDLLTFVESFHIENELDWTIPEWATNYKLPTEQDTEKKLKDLLKKKEEVNSKISKQKEDLNYLNKLKCLFTSQGDSLEEIVAKVFIDFGFSLDEAKPFRDDLIVKIDDKIGVVEIKGVKKSAAEKHAVQLQKWVTNYHLEMNVNPKGILVVNTFYDTPLNDRIGNDNFPDQMMAYVHQMNHCVLTSLQLLYIYLDFLEGKIKLTEITKMFFETIGELVYKKIDTSNSLLFFDSSQ